MKRLNVCGPPFKGIVGALLLAMLLSPGAADGPKWRVARPDYTWSFPQDHWSRQGYKTEWWYFTGHLKTDDGHRFGYQFTFFRVGVLPTRPAFNSDWATHNLIMGHAAISDLDRQEHRFSEVLYRAIPLLGGFASYPDKPIAWSRGPAGTAGTWQLTWNGAAFDFAMTDTHKGFAFTLSTHPEKPLILQGPNGYSRKGIEASAASQYYSFTRLQTTGRITIDGQSRSVTGRSWMDKEFGSNQLSASQIGWDWFSLQLDDQRDIMLYMLRDQKGSVDYARGTVVHPNGQTIHLTQNDFTVTVEKRWQSSTTSSPYPSRWRVSIPQEGLKIDIAPEMANQENRSRLIPTLHYWEGAVTILQHGQRLGQGYVELTGYGKASRPAI